MECAVRFEIIAPSSVWRHSSFSLARLPLNVELTGRSMSLLEIRAADRRRFVTTGPDSISALVRKLILGGGRREKGEFETSEHFDASQAALLKANSRRLIFLKDVTPGVKEFVYDADTGMMAVQLPEAIASLTDQGTSSRTITAKSVFNGSPVLCQKRVQCR
ncbi:MAG: hypothetical protein QOJ99_4011, partial [Bryobacterales bacterium]|nr:hypothetical protein [Bryobacterales bacterium]